MYDGKRQKIGVDIFCFYPNFLGKTAGLFSSILTRLFGFGDPLAYLVIIVDFVINF